MSNLNHNQIVKNNYTVESKIKTIWDKTRISVAFLVLLNIFLFYIMVHIIDTPYKNQLFMFIFIVDIIVSILYKLKNKTNSGILYSIKKILSSDFMKLGGFMWQMFSVIIYAIMSMNYSLDLVRNNLSNLLGFYQGLLIILVFGFFVYIKYKAVKNTILHFTEENVELNDKLAKLSQVYNN